jgi:hypothetical protein
MLACLGERYNTQMYPWILNRYDKRQMTNSCLFSGFLPRSLFRMDKLIFGFSCLFILFRDLSEGCMVPLTFRFREPFDQLLANDLRLLALPLHLHVSTSSGLQDELTVENSCLQPSASASEAISPVIPMSSGRRQLSRPY